MYPYPDDHPIFAPFLRLAHAPNESALSATWTELLKQASHPMATLPGPHEPLVRHIPHNHTAHVWDLMPHLFGHRGIYVFGAWTGDDARVQYIGIADAQSLESRFLQRYLDELTMAQNRAFLRCDEDFSVGRLPSMQKYIDLGIEVDPSRPHRPMRAERYAKVGLRHLWYFVLPAPGKPVPQFDATGKRRMDPLIGRLEGALSKRTSAALFRAHRSNQDRCFPLLNRNKIGPDFLPNDRATRAAYSGWLREGTWWPEMASLAARRRAQDDN
jgi:hypothetical protein